MHVVHVTWNTEGVAGFLDVGKGPRNPQVPIRQHWVSFQAYLPGLIGQAVVARSVASFRGAVTEETRVHVRSDGWTGPF